MIARDAARKYFPILLLVYLVATRKFGRSTFVCLVVNRQPNFQSFLSYTNEPLLRPLGLETDLGFYIIIYISFSTLTHLAVGGSLISFPLIY